MSQALHLSNDRNDSEQMFLISIDFLRFYFSVISLVLVSIEKINQTLKTVFLRISKHLEVLQKYSAARRIFNSLYSVWENAMKHYLSCWIYYIFCMNK